MQDPSDVSYGGGSHRYDSEPLLSRSNGLTSKPVQAKIITCKEDGKPYGGVRVAVNSKNYRSFDTLLTDLTSKMPDLSHGVRAIYTSRGRNRVKGIDQFENGGQYICTQSLRRPRMIGTQFKPAPSWKGGKPPSGRRAYSFSLRNDENNGTPEWVRQRQNRGKVQPRSYPGSDTDASPQPYPPTTLYKKVECKRITVFKSGDPFCKHVVLLNRRTNQEFNEFLGDLSDMFSMQAGRMFIADKGLTPVNSLSAIFNGPNEFVVAPPSGPVKAWYPAVNGQTKRKPRGRDMEVAANTQKRHRINRNRTFWLCITTHPDPDAGTTSHVSITICGLKRCTDPIPLVTTENDGIIAPFEAGSKDEFKINVGDIGDITKVRLSHDNSGDSPGWYVGEMLMTDMATQEQLKFRFDRWLSKDHDHGETCRELPAIRPGENTSAVLNYHISVHTGDCYNAGTDANVSVILMGDKGDTGLRPIWKSIPTKENLFQKGDVDNFIIEAVDLGRIRKMMIAHDGMGPGCGWFLEKVIVRDSDRPDASTYIFMCNTWLDEGEEGGKTAVELVPVDSSKNGKHDDIMWDCERWKFLPGNEIILFNKGTESALRFNNDGTVDALGAEKDPKSILKIVDAHGMNINLQSRADPQRVLAFVDGLVTTGQSSNPNTTLRVHINPDRSLGLMWTKQAMKPLAFNSRGLPVDSNSSSTITPEGNVFVPYCKGMFREDGIIMFGTTSTQTLSLDHNTLNGTGKRNKMAQFRVHKMDEGRVRMFESVVFRDQFIRIKDGQCDCVGTGDASCHFRVDICKDKNFVTLQSVNEPDLCIGFDSSGRAVATKDEGRSNVRLYPEVIQFGIPKKRAHIDNQAFKTYTPSPQATPERKSPRIPTPTPASSRPPSVRREEPPATVPEDPAESYLDGDWRLWIHTASTASTFARVVFYVYGRNGNSGRILLGSSSGGNLFQAGHRDEFKISLNELEDIFKIRVELEPESWFDLPPQWTINEIIMENPNSRSRYTFDFTDRHLSRDSTDMELSREAAVNDMLPLVSYIVTVSTGSVPSAETDSNIFIALIGENGDSGRRVLYDHPTVRLFREGQTDNFKIEAVHLGTLKRCLIGHDDQIGGNGWFCERITVTDPLTQMEYIFNCQQWLDTDKDDGKIERILKASGSSPDEAPNVDLDKYEFVQDSVDVSARSPVPQADSRPGTSLEDENILSDAEKESERAQSAEPGEADEQVNEELLQIRKDAQHLIDDVTERVAKRIEDHHAKGEHDPHYSTDFEDFTPNQTYRDPENIDEQLEAIKEEASLLSGNRTYNGIHPKSFDYVDGADDKKNYTPYDGDDDIAAGRHAETPNISNEYQQTPRENGVF